jgi:hypothetical protein
MEVSEVPMPKDDRDLLEVLRFELEFLEKGGYGRSPRTPWRPQFIFEDSPTCMNYDSKENPAPCSECLLMQFVPAESRGEKIPCRHILLNEAGETIESFYRTGTQVELEETYGKWLRQTIRKLELERAEARGKFAGQPKTKAGVAAGTK